MKQPLSPLAWIMLLWAVPLSTSLFAQSSPPPSPSPRNDETIALSPFIVAESENIGYAASSTLAGTRLEKWGQGRSMFEAKEGGCRLNCVHAWSERPNARASRLSQD